MARSNNTVDERELGRAIFREEQKMRQLWVWILTLASTLGPLILLTWGLWQQLVVGQVWGDRPLPDGALIGLWLGTAAIAAMVIILLAKLNLITEVFDSGIRIRYHGLKVDQLIRNDEIESFKAVTYRPIRDYGGWGLRGPKSDRAYNVSGDRGLRLVLKDGNRLLIGSLRANELARAIARHHRP